MRTTTIFTGLAGLLLPLLSLTSAGAQANAPMTHALRAPLATAPSPLPTVAVSDSYTTYLVFPGPVGLVDVGQASHYLVKIEANAVFVRARRASAPPTPLLIRYGSSYWLGRLVYSARPVLHLYDFQAPGNGASPPIAQGRTG